VNPKWRAHTADGRLSQSGEGDWEVLRKPGLNGLLSVIVFLKFWVDAIEQEEVAGGDLATVRVDWAWFVSDACFVVKSLLGDTTRKRAADTPAFEEMAPAKKK
ncbi:hypothetical protein PILCRDRAFT_9621, partial [Piloderma croceum F 1598]